ncbi:hypothetical protein PQX77_017765 [Marasmius sp. AFHP31]|nr:hypothetical protein PQX77_017765 [Marasmius sp. AFHP31]
MNQAQVDIEQWRYVTQPPGGTHDTGLGMQAFTQSTHTLRTQASTQNTNTGLGSQNNNNHSGTQYNQYGNGQIGQVSGGEVNLHFNAKGSDGFKRLSDAIAGVGASHKAEHQFSRGECLEGTRVSARTAIHDWASAKGPEALPICWLSGAAGVGKSAIALTIAELFAGLGLLTSSFFFFRSDPRRNNPSALILTIAHGLATTTPLMRNHIEQRISTDPTILEARLEEQFHELIFVPALIWGKQRSLWGAPAIPNVVIIDGLDECGNEDTQLRILSIIQSALQEVLHFPLRFLVCSRPEAWIGEAFSDEPLSRLSKNIILDDSLEAREDVRRYFVHHFREIATSRKYRHVQFPSPWPSEQDLGILVGRSCAQFVYAATLVQFIKLAYGHPITHLCIILNSTAEHQPSNIPYHDLDCLYQVILSANPIQDELILILVAILILPEYNTEATPAVIEGVLGLPSGQVDLTLRGMYSVLKIGGWKDEIELYHTSFRDYLLDHTRSGIDIAAQKHIIACWWLQGLSIDRLQNWRYGPIYYVSQRLLICSTYPFNLSNHQFYDMECFNAVGWIPLCMSIPKPTLDLLDNLWSVDLGAVFSWWMDSGDTRTWKKVFHFGDLVSWVKKYPCGGTSEVELVEALVHKLQGLPRCFHLVWPPGVEPQQKIMYGIAQYATECPHFLRLDTGNIDWDQQPVLLSECRCNLSGEQESHNPQHIAYQDACMEYAKALTSKFAEMIAQGDREEAGPGIRLEEIFCNLVESALLKHCCLGTELFLLCQTFFKLVKGYTPIFNFLQEYAMERGKGDLPGKGKANLLEWIEGSVICSWFGFLQTTLFHYDGIDNCPF